MHEPPVITVVVVDDTPANRWVVARILEEAGYHIVQGATSAEAVRLAGNLPDLMVLDVRLPDGNGFDVAKRIKADPATAAIPVLLISASFTSPSARAQGLDAGADGYLTHPVEPPVLLATVRALLRTREAEHALRETIAAETAARSEADALRVAAEQANVAKAQFLASMSHELRTPLNAIAGYIDLLELGVRGELNRAQLDDLARIRHNQRHLLGVINNILNFAKVEAGHVDFDIEDVPVLELLESVGPLIQPQREAKQLSYRCEVADDSLVVRGDADKVQQILLNLLSNAIKFTPTGGGIDVSAERRSEEIAIHVHDTGRGIPPEKLDAIFEPFVQVDQHLTREGQGTGLGLAISRELARAMNGDLTVTSRLGEGARFTLTLPVGGRSPVVGGRTTDTLRSTERRPQASDIV